MNASWRVRLRLESDAGDVRLVTDAMANEEDEVRALLMRHRKQIIRDVNESKLIPLLTQKGVLNLSSERLFGGILTLPCNNDQTENNGKIAVETQLRSPIQSSSLSSPSSSTTTQTITPTISENVAKATPTSTSVNNSDSLIVNEIDEKKCNILIDLISKNGFEKFKEFCYAIESACPQLIEDLINDRIRGGKSISHSLRCVCWCIYSALATATATNRWHAVNWLSAHIQRLICCLCTYFTN